MNTRPKEVDFKHYCPKCEHAKLNEAQMPCDECLEYFFNDGSQKPIHYKEKEKNG